MKKNTLPAGKYMHIYRDSMNAGHKRSLNAFLDRCKVWGFKGVLWHGFTTEMTPSVFKPLAKLCSDRGLLALAAFGLNSEEPEAKAVRMAEVANMPECFALVLDAEGAWEDEVADKAKAKQMCKKLRELCPNALIIDQPWPVPTYHWTLFPWEEFAECVDMRAAQWYCNDFASNYGENRYVECWKWFSSSWKRLDERLAKSGLVKPEIKTIQGYKWVLKDLIHCLTNEPTLFIWTMPFPDELFMKALDIVKKLEDLGFTGPVAVKNFQLSTNGKLVADNIWGPKTEKELHETSL
jgi:hypothetical protein